MKQYTQKEFIKIVEKNGFHYDRHSGSHAIYINDGGRHISIPKNLESVIALRLIKENNLDINLKRRKKRMNNYEYPEGADNPRAPWNEKEVKFREMNVYVSIVLSKRVKIRVPETDIQEREIDDCLLRQYVKEQIHLPQDSGDLLADIVAEAPDGRYCKIINDLTGWDTDDIEVVFD